VKHGKKKMNGSGPISSFESFLPSYLVPGDLIAEFRTSPMPRIAVTVDMIATGTDIKPLEVVLFMRSVKSRSFFEQMKGRGVRVINDDDLKAVTPDAKAKDHFIIVDAVGVCEQDKTDSRPMEKKRNVSFEKLLQSVSLGNIEPEVISSIAVRMARMEHAISAEDHTEIRKLADKSLKILCAGLITAIDPDRHVERAKLDNPGVAEPSEAQIQKAAAVLIQEAVKPLHNPELRELLVDLKKKSEQTIDVVSKDRVIEAGFSAQALEKAKGLVQSFVREGYIFFRTGVHSILLCVAAAASCLINSQAVWADVADIEKESNRPRG